MITRFLFSSFCLISLLTSGLAGAAGETGGTTEKQSAPAAAPTIKAIAAASGVQAAPAQRTPAISAPAAVTTPPITKPPVPHTPKTTPPAKPVPVPAPLAKPVPRQIPAKKPAEVTAPHIKPATLQSAPAASQALAESSPVAALQTSQIEFFVREDCIQCDKAKEFLDKLQNMQPQLHIVTRDVRKEPAALELLKRVAQSQGDIALDYPAFVVGGQLIIGFSDETSTAQFILDRLPVPDLAANHASTDASNCETVSNPNCGLITPAPEPKPEAATINLFDYNVPLLQIGLPLFTVVMGLLDGLNHGSTWVLVLMISLLAPMKNRSVMLAIAGTFIAVQGLIYFAILAAWLHLFTYIGNTHIAGLVVAAIAVIFAVFYLTKYLNFGQRISLTSHEIHKPGIYTRIRKIVQANSLVYALFGTVILSILIQIGELAYRSAFPAFYTKVLTLQHLDHLSNYTYLLLYDFSYILDDIIILTIGVITLNAKRVQEKEGRVLIFFSSLMMAGIAAYLLLPLY